MLQLPEKAYIASVDVHTQNTFTPLCPNELPVPDGHLIVDELNAGADYASVRIGSKESHHPNAVWIADEEHPPLSAIENQPNADIRWPAHSIVGTFGGELIKGLPAITDYDYFVWEGIELNMHPYGVCYHDHAEKLSTGVIEFLRQRNITHVIVGGLATDYCVKASVLQLLKANFNVIVNLGACRGIAADTIDSAIRDMKSQGAIMINSASELA